ncbi:VCBS repeat-containing protein [Maribacter sp. 2210JD10-5]|uniref:VCBS repeat-containing protein n=1 Tax=Maribacter sp. 2210JD10-5 TaxID=3386272 RepID=UPI0039BC8BE8
MKTKLIFLLFLPFVFGCIDKNTGEVFKKLSPEKTGVKFSNNLTESNDLNILDYLYFYNGGGVAIGDINNDSLPDIFLSANQTENKLYLNKGNLVFEDISESAGISGNSSWNTGAVMADVNNDGLLDIYVCAVVGLNGFNGHNELFINQGEGIFKEMASSYGLDFESYSSNAAFLDYDLDGDLDMYLLNHAIHTQESFGKVALRYERNYETGDKLLRNDNGKFVDVSEAAGIFGGINGYGLGIAVSDFNQDGYPDIFIGNDFHEDDYYYLNNGDGTFTESLKKYFGHTSRFSMGNDVADLNHDGLPDLISLDMLPDEEKVLKSSEGDDNVQIQKLRTNTYGYHYQFTRNMLYINQPDGKFMETGLQNGVAATDWSWSALFSDYDQDGEQDLFISNGIPKRPNDLDYINFVSNEKIQNKINNTNLVDQKALNLMPSGNVNNRIFQGKSNLHFEDRSRKWLPYDTLVSGATAYGDLDNDGDLDLVINNLNSSVSIYENLTNEKGNFLKIKFNYKNENPFGIGTKVYSYIDGKKQFKELFTVRGFQSSSEPIIHFGYGNIAKIDSLKVIWPDKTYQTLKNVTTNQTITIIPNNPKAFSYESLKQKRNLLFGKVKSNLGINFKHEEDRYTDFNRQPLIPYQLSDRGPAIAIGDINNDGREDVFFGGSKFVSPEIFVQTDTSFSPVTYPIITKDSIKENVVALLKDFNNDGSQELLVGNGGADFFNQMKPLTDNHFSIKDSIVIAMEFPELFNNTSVIVPIDFDGDGDLDIFLGNQSVSADFGNFPDSYVLQNNDGKFIVNKNNTFKNLGMVTDAIAEDFDLDGDEDLIIVGEWMAPQFYKNENAMFSLVENLDFDSLKGLWQTIESFDIDGDGDQDYLLGNWGNNTKFTASEEKPMKMFYADFDENGTTETIITTSKNNTDYPLEGLDELSSQLIFLRKKFNSYSSFAGKSITEILDADMLDKTTILTVSMLKSGYLKNENGTFSFVPFNFVLQTAPLMSFLRYDFDKDGKEEILVGGNYFGIKPFHGRLDSFPGALINNEEDIVTGNEVGLDFMSKSVRHLNIVHLNEEPYLLATFNNEPAQVYRLLKK